MLSVLIEIVSGPVLYLMFQNFDFNPSDGENVYLYKYIGQKSINDFKALFASWGYAYLLFI